MIDRFYITLLYIKSSGATPTNGVALEFVDKANFITVSKLIVVEGAKIPAVGKGQGRSRKA